MNTYSSNCLISLGWLASIAEDDSIINATLLRFYFQYSVFSCQSLMTGLMFYRPEDHIRYLQECLKKIRDEGVDKVRWNLFIESRRKTPLPPITPDGRPRSQQGRDKSFITGEIFQAKCCINLVLLVSTNMLGLLLGNCTQWSSITALISSLTLKVLVTTIDAQWEGMRDVGLERYELALLPPCPTIRVLSYSN